MRVTMLGVCIFAAGCSGQDLVTPTAPASPASALTGAPAHGPVQLPFRGSYSVSTQGGFVPPATLAVNGTAEGTATQLGRFTATYIIYVDLTTATGTGTITITAANGDWLRADLAGGEEGFTPPNISYTKMVATITEGTGRFASASGTFTIHESGAIDYVAMTSAGSGSFEGTITFGR